MEALDPLNLRAWFRDYPWLPHGEQTIEVRPEARTVVLTSQKADLTGKMCKAWAGTRKVLTSATSSIFGM